MYDLTIEKMLELHSYLDNIIENTEIFVIEQHRTTCKVLKSQNIAFNIENKFLANFTGIFHRILENFFDEENFEFIDGKIQNLGF